MELKKALNKIEKTEKIVENIGKFLKTKRGTTFVSKLHTAPLRELCIRYNAPKFILSCSNDTVNLNLIRAAIDKYDVQLPKEVKTMRLEPPKRVKTQLCMTRKELKEYNIAKRPRKMDFAALIHAYEEYKMNKFMKVHPAPTERELAEDLFPDELKKAWDTMASIHREYVRSMLRRKYYKEETRNDFYRLFIVYKKSEVEGDPYVVGYPFTHIKEWNAHTPIEKVKAKLQIKAKYYCADSNAIGLRVYNKYGIAVAYSTIPRTNFENS